MHEVVVEENIGTMYMHLRIVNLNLPEGAICQIRDAEIFFK